LDDGHEDKLALGRDRRNYAATSTSGRTRRLRSGKC
jgi:hypothetical protein